MATGGVDDLEKGTDETFDFLCSVCNSKDKISEAELFCSDCHDYYCRICVKCHDDIPALKKHRILNKAEFQPGSGDTFPKVPTEQCKVHGHKPVDMYCKVHDSVGCSTCMVVEHSACTDKFYVPEFVKRDTSAVNTKYTTDMLAAISQSLKNMEKAVIKQKEKLESNKHKIAQQIRKLRESINQILDDLEKNTFQELERSFQSLIQTTEEKLKELQAAKAEVESAVDGLNSAGGNTSQAFVRISITKNVVSNAKEILSSATCQNYSISFDADQKLQSLFKDIHVLGSVSLTDNTESKSLACSPDSFTPVTKIRSNPQSFQVNQSELSLLQITGHKRCRVRVDSDKDTCHIVSACTLEDGTVILADQKNRNLKRLDRSIYTVTDYCVVPRQPWKVCAISDQLVAVCCGYSQEIYFVAVGNTMQIVRKIRTNHVCYDITCADKKLFVSTATTVNVYAVSGEFLQHFASDLTNQKLFLDIECIAVSKDKTKIYVADSKQGLITLDINGLLVRHVKGTASGICFHKTGSVLVDCRASRNILQYSPNGKLIGEVLKTDHKCQAVCCNINGSKLIVCFMNSDTIDVYNVK